MIWPWQKHRQEADAAAIEAAGAVVEKEAAEVRLQAAHLQAEQSRVSTDLLKRQIELNGWTELLQTAWGRRA